jgi:hypothetical protein
MADRTAATEDELSEQHLRKSADSDDKLDETNDIQHGDANSQQFSTSIDVYKEKSAEPCSDPHPDLVDWDSNDSERPVNWSNPKKCMNLGLVFFFRFLTPLASSMVAPVTGLIQSDLGLNNDTLASFIVSVFILGYAVGPLVISPLSEMYGRRPLYHVNNVLFTCWNLGNALAPTWRAVIVFRLLAGLAGSCSVTIGSGSIADCVRKERRGLVTTIFSE